MDRPSYLAIICDLPEYTGDELVVVCNPYYLISEYLHSLNKLSSCSECIRICQKYISAGELYDLMDMAVALVSVCMLSINLYRTFHI